MQTPFRIIQEWNAICSTIRAGSIAFHNCSPLARNLIKIGPFENMGELRNVVDDINVVVCVRVCGVPNSPSSAERERGDGAGETTAVITKFGKEKFALENGHVAITQLGRNSAREDARTRGRAN